MKVESLHIYPVKGLRAVDLEHSLVEPRGLSFDRRWMLVDEQGKFISQREHPKLATLNAEIVENGVYISGPTGNISIAAPANDAPRLPATLWKQPVEGYLADQRAQDWFSNFLGVTCSLVYQGGLPRQVSTQYAAEGVHASYADGFPILLANAASLDDLNRRMPKPLPMNRFRPNIVISGSAPWAEDSWKKLRIGSLVVDIVKPCLRCVVTTTDQQTGEKDNNEPLNTLKNFRLLRQPGLIGVVFGQNAIPVASGVVARGDAVEVLETQAAPAFVA